MNKIENECGLVQDLLPLYVDKICSDTSRRIVDEHLQECEACSRIKEQLSNTEIDKRLLEEKDRVLITHAEKERKTAVKMGITTAGVLLVPIVICLICNLAVGHGLDWFFIVLTSMMIVASFTVVPMLVYEKKMFYSILSGTVSLVLLLLTCCIYSQGDWFFLTTIPTIFGFSVVLMPYMLTQVSFNKGNDKIQRLGNHKGLITMLWDTIWLYATIIVCGLHTTAADYWRISLSVTSVMVIIPWVIFAIIRYTKLHKMAKTGLIIGFLGVYTLVANDVLTLLLDRKFDIRLTHMDFTTWTWTEGMGEEALAALNANINCTIAFICIIIGAVLMLAGRRLNKNDIEKSIEKSIEK